MSDERQPTVLQSIRRFLRRDVQSEEYIQQRYEMLLDRAKLTDLTEVSDIGYLYQSGEDRHGYPVVIFIGRWFSYNRINLDKALLHLITVLDSISNSNYIVVYFHTQTTTSNYPPFSWLEEVYNLLPHKYKKNLSKLYIVHPSRWTKMMTYLFTTFKAPALKQKVQNLSGLEYLHYLMFREQLEIPAFITEYDISINGINYYRPSNEACSLQ